MMRGSSTSWSPLTRISSPVPTATKSSGRTPPGWRWTTVNRASASRLGRHTLAQGRAQTVLTILTLLRHALWRGVGREGDPGVSGLFPDRDRGRWKVLVGEGADGNSDVTGKALALPIDCGAAGWAKVEGECVAALRRARPRGGLAAERDLLAAE